ncbi:PREDICTED: cysteine-rich with EGF-like domain protein 1, partial [Nicrophorus vespilloides]
MCSLYKSIAVLLSISVIALEGVQPSNNKDLIKQKRLPPCRACKTFVDSFKRGMERTEKGKFEGGDAAWEEEKLKSYSKSEIRLVEIQE